jgi:hypothetical protein
MSNGEEADILRTMVQDRDQRILLIQRQTQEQVDKESRLEQELDGVNMETNRFKIAHQTEKTRLLHSFQSTSSRLESVQRDLQQQTVTLQNYATVVQKQNKPDAAQDSNYVMRMQAQLCKAMHSMGIVDHQFDLMQAEAEALVKFQKESIAQTAEEKTELELQLLNGLMNVDNAKREMEAKFQKELDLILKEISNINEQLEEDSDDEDKGDDEVENEEVDEEENNAKEELLKMLQSRKDQIEKLETATEEQAEVIEDLQGQLAEFGPIDPSLAPIVTPRPPPPETDPPPPDSQDEEEDYLAIVAARSRAAQAIVGSEDGSDVEDMDEIDLLKFAKSRLAGEDPTVKNGVEEESESESNTDFDESSAGEVDEEDEDIVETSSEMTPVLNALPGSLLGNDDGSIESVDGVKMAVGTNSVAGSIPTSPAPGREDGTTDNLLVTTEMQDDSTDRKSVDFTAESFATAAQQEQVSETPVNLLESSTESADEATPNEEAVDSSNAQSILSTDSSDQPDGNAVFNGTNTMDLVENKLNNQNIEVEAPELGRDDDDAATKGGNTPPNPIEGTIADPTLEESFLAEPHVESENAVKDERAVASEAEVNGVELEKKEAVELTETPPATAPDRV